uniref:Uncharacterized protein n=1 Tax=Alexandrium catenella TaxID=2925 RepID=A0A7S1WMK1_ALECA|mmetsp:Transcript_74529/g.197973  ORF Transcript_74529/g.197973 Transcript_74529/m.197973 type:complete len:280 (+) Transcript_74529:82-921(+)
MAGPNTELQRKLAKRRSFGEQVFEHEAAPSSADATSSTASASAATATSKAADHEEEDASESSAAYRAALQKIREFERRGSMSKGVMHGRGSGSTPSAKESKVPPGRGSVRLMEAAADERRLAGRGSADEAPAPARKTSFAEAVCVSEHSAASDSDRGAQDSQLPSAPAKQQDFKSLVQLRFAALIREGLTPNEAAARAILEAAGQQAETEAGPLGSSNGGAAVAEGAGQAAGARSSGSAASSPASPRSECSRRSCASSAKGKEAGSKRGKSKKAVAVIA